MKEPAAQRQAIVKRLLSLNLSTKTELDDIIQLTAAICQTSAILISLLDKEKQYLCVSIGFDNENTNKAELFCHYAMRHDGITEVWDIRSDEQFSHHRFTLADGEARFYAGIRLEAPYGEILGCLCLFDTRPEALTRLQKNCLLSLAKQITNILQLESSLVILKEEIRKVQDSEMKLTAIFQSSPDQYILIGKDFTIKAVNKAAEVFSTYLSNRTMKEGDNVLDFISPDVQSDFIEQFEQALTGQNVVGTRKISYENKGDFWWQAKYNPVYNHLNEIIGVSLNVTDVTDMLRDKESITAQNLAFQKIAQIQSHELRRPVANIIELTGVLSDRKDENFDLHLAYLKEEVSCLDEKIHQIVALSSSNNISHATASGYDSDLSHHPAH